MVGGRLYLPLTDALNGWWQVELAMEPTAIGLVSLHSNSETHMTVICDARPIYGRGWISRVFICCAALTYTSLYIFTVVDIWSSFGKVHPHGKNG